MLLTEQEVADRGLNIKAWLSELQIAAKEANAPTFKLKGACKLKVRSRRASRGGETSSVNWTFMGQEEFRVSGFFPEKLPTGATLTSVTLVPAAAKLATEVSSMTLTLAEAIELFEGPFETWITEANERAALRKTQAQTQVERVTAHVPQKAEDNPDWGSW